MELNQVPKNGWKLFLQHLLNFCNKSNTFCINFFLRKRGFSCFVPIFCASRVFVKNKKVRNGKNHNKMKNFFLWNIFQKTISNLSKLSSKIVSILYFLRFWRDFFIRFFLNLRKNIKETQKSIIKHFSNTKKIFS